MSDPTRSIDAWTAADGEAIAASVVEDCVIRTFEYTWKGDRREFQGARDARTVGILRAEMREYRTTAPLYDWQGAWH